MSDPKPSKVKVTEVPEGIEAIGIPKGVLEYTAKILSVIQPQANWAPSLLREFADAKEFWAPYLPKPKNEGTNDVSPKK